MLKVSNYLLLISVLYGYSVNVIAASDPTKPPSSVMQKLHTKPETQRQQVTAVTLNAITIKGNSRIAIINGQSVSVGQIVAGEIITSISKYKVVLGSGKELSLFDKSQITVVKKGF